MANASTLKWVQAAAYILGPSLVAFNLASVKVAKAGYYFLQNNEIGLALGVGLYTLSIVLKTWNRN